MTGAIKGNIVSDSDIAQAKQTIRDLIAVKEDVELAIKAGITPDTTMASINEKIDKLKTFIRVYTGENFNP
jgi:Holliday junction resolvase